MSTIRNSVLVSANRSGARRRRLVLALVQPSATGLPAVLPLGRDSDGRLHAPVAASPGSGPPRQGCRRGSVWHDLRVRPEQQRGPPQRPQAGRESHAHRGQHQICGGPGHLYSPTQHHAGQVGSDAKMLRRRGLLGFLIASAKLEGIILIVTY